MKFKIPIKALTAALKAVVPTAGRRSTLPILSGVMIEASGSKVVFEATDLEASARITVKDGVKVFQEGRVVLPSKAFGKAVSTMNGEEAELLADEGSHRGTLLADHVWSRSTASIPPIGPARTWTMYWSLDIFCFMRATPCSSTNRCVLNFAMPEPGRPFIGKRLKRIAFAAELLMPRDILHGKVVDVLGRRSEEGSRVKAALAKRFEVSGQAMQFRLTNLGYWASL
ncbi:MAG: hypothetical protein WAT66_10910 [Actinomycetota bacterium]